MQLMCCYVNIAVAQDLKALKGLPSVEVIQKSVQAAYLALLTLVKKWGGADSSDVPLHVWGEANACLAGAIVLDTFGGRKLEWEVLPLSQVA